MRGALFVAALCIVAPPALACTVSNPYRPLTALPAGAEAALLVDVVALDFRHYSAIAQIRVVHGGRPAANTRAIRYWRAICGGRRDPVKGDRLYAYLRGGDALGWATQAEAKAFGRHSATKPPHVLSRLTDDRR